MKGHFFYVESLMRRKIEKVFFLKLLLKPMKMVFFVSGWEQKVNVSIKRVQSQACLSFAEREKRPIGR